MISYHSPHDSRYRNQNQLLGQRNNDKQYLNLLLVLYTSVHLGISPDLHYRLLVIYTALRQPHSTNFNSQHCSEVHIHSQLVAALNKADQTSLTIKYTTFHTLAKFQHSVVRLVVHTVPSYIQQKSRYYADD